MRQRRRPRFGAFFCLVKVGSLVCHFPLNQNLNNSARELLRSTSRPARPALILLQSHGNSGRFDGSRQTARRCEHVWFRVRTNHSSGPGLWHLKRDTAKRAGRIGGSSCAGELYGVIDHEISHGNGANDFFNIKNFLLRDHRLQLGLPSLSGATNNFCLNFFSGIADID